jgi:DUF4097 and DUF4098 domain-containing protein YvlB
MKTKQWHYKFTLLALLLSAYVQGQTYERSRSVLETFYAPPSAEIQVTNKYGDIHLIPWDIDSVRFEIQLVVTSNKESKIDKVFDYVDFDFKLTKYYIIAQTIFKNKNTFWSEVADVASMVFSGGTHTQIDYTIFYPAKNELKIENKFGNLYAGDHIGTVDFRVSNGDIKAHSFTGPTKLQIEFGNATIEQVNSATFVVNYGELYLEQAAELILESKSSKIFLTECDWLQLDSKRDKYYIKYAGEVSGTSYFSDLNFDLLGKHISLQTKYGDVKIQTVKPGFQRMEFGSESTSITLYISRELYYDIDVTRNDRTQMVFTSSLLTKTETALDDKNETFRVKCTAGKAGKPVVPVKINAKSGKIFLMNL